MHLSTFLFGIASMKVILDRKNLSTWSPKAYLIIFISATPLLLWILTNNTPMVQLSHNGLLSPLFAALVFSIIHLPKKISLFLSSKQMQYIGEISYALYIIQYPTMLLLHYVNRLSGWQIYQSKEIEFVLLLCLLFVLSALSHSIFEMPAKRWIRNIEQK